MTRLAALVRIACFCSALIIVGACTHHRSSEPDVSAKGHLEDIHERLSDAISRAGFSHRLVSDRNASEHIDSIHLRIPLDGMKRRHEGVERVLANISQVCALPQYSQLPIRIVVATKDEADGAYLRSVLEKHVAGSDNISFQIVVGSSEGVVIAVNHPARGAFNY